MMISKFIILSLGLTMALSACAAVDTGTPVVYGPSQSDESPAVVDVISTVTTTDITPTFEGCAYVWASHELPDLSDKVYKALQALDTNYTGNAYAYGENCVYADGHTTFSSMETDFRVKVTVTDLKDQNSLGDHISRIMRGITNFPADQIPGGEPGRVEFDFSKGENEDLFLNVSIAKYQKDAAGLSGVELFKLFNNNP
jgi:hypothetical protein